MKHAATVRENRWRRHEAVSASKVFLAAACLAVTTLGTASASPIRTFRVVTSDTEASLGPEWARFLAGGPFFWSVETPPSFPSGLVLETLNGRIVETPFVDYLIWRRNQDPARFDLNHPNVGPPLGQILIPPRTPTNPPINPQPQLPGIPEPASLLTTLVIASSSVLWWRRRRPTSV
ncbi:MAG: hypothetical protein U0835_17440 [Isosphaeraceae bacterium]